MEKPGYPFTQTTSQKEELEQAEIMDEGLLTGVHLGTLRLGQIKIGRADLPISTKKGP